MLVKTDLMSLILLLFLSEIVLINSKIIKNVFLTGLIKQVIKHHAQLIYTRTTKGDDPAA